MKLIFAFVLLSLFAFEGQCWSKEKKAEEHQPDGPEGLEYSPLTVLGQVIKKKEKVVDPVLNILYDAVAKFVYVVKAVEEKKLKLLNKAYSKFVVPAYTLELTDKQQKLSENSEFTLQDDSLIPYHTSEVVHGSTKLASPAQPSKESSVGHKGVSAGINKGSSDHSSHGGVSVGYSTELDTKAASLGHQGVSAGYIKDSSDHSSHGGVSVGYSSELDTKDSSLGHQGVSLGVISGSAGHSSYSSVERDAREEIHFPSHKGVSLGQPITEEESYFGSGDESHKGVWLGEPISEEESYFGSGDGPYVI